MRFLLCHYQGSKLDESKAFSNGKLQTKTLLANAKKEPLDFARLIGFGITNKIGAPYVWGLKDNMLKPETIQWQHKYQAYSF